MNDFSNNTIKKLLQQKMNRSLNRQVQDRNISLNTIKIINIIPQQNNNFNLNQNPYRKLKIFRNYIKKPNFFKFITYILFKTFNNVLNKLVIYKLQCNNCNVEYIGHILVNL